VIDEEPESRREQSRRQRREAGNRSAEVARKLMELSDQAVAAIELPENVRDAVTRARRTGAMVAKRREERRLAGVLRKVDLAEVEQQLETQSRSGRADARLFQRTESWRSRLIDEGKPAIEQFCSELVGLEKSRWEELVGNAQREKSDGAPKGASKVLFRAITAALKAQRT